MYAKFTLEVTSVGFYAGVKYTIAAVIFLLMYPPKKKDLFGPHSKEIILKSVLSIISLSLFYVGITRVTGFTATMIIALTPILLFVSSIEVMHEKFKIRVLSGLAVALSGVLLMILATGGGLGGSNTFFGVSLILASIIVETTSTLVSKKILKERVLPETLAGVTLATSALYFLTVAVWQSGLESTKGITAQAWILTAVAGLVFTLIPWGFYYKALKKIDLEEVSVFGYLGPVAGAIGAVVLLGERITLPILVGSGLVLLGLWLSQHGASHFKPHFHALHHIRIRRKLF